MKSVCSSLLLAACTAAAAPSAWAATASAEAPGTAQYRSAFEGYRPFREEPLANWRSVNDEVGRVGGHVGIMRAPSAPAAGRAETGQPPVRGAPQAPGDHKHH